MMNANTSQKWVLALTSLVSLMVALDVLVVTTALSNDPARPGRVARQPRVDGQRLQPQLRGPAHARGGARRPLRTAKAARLRARALRRRVGRVRALARRRLADRRARRPGRR